VWPTDDLADALVEAVLDEAGVERTGRLPDGVRLSERDGTVWVTNFTDQSVTVDVPADADWLLGEETVGAYDLSVVAADLSALSVRRD
jgi:beta-galactosidase